MNRIIVGEPLKTQLDGLAEPAEVVDETGRALGHFVPCQASAAEECCPYSQAELERMRAERGGRTLSEIWKALEAR